MSSFEGVLYQVFVRSFADSNGDGIGDLKGLTEKLEYIKDLGADAIWLMPIHPSPSYHHYDVLDYYAMAPEYGTFQDFEQLMEKAKSLNIRVIIDLIINHCSERHPWFQAARDKNSKYRDYFIWKEKSAITKAKKHNIGLKKLQIAFELFPKSDGFILSVLGIQMHGCIQSKSVHSQLQPKFSYFIDFPAYFGMVIVEIGHAFPEVGVVVLISIFMR